MKKFCSFILIFAMLFCMPACSTTPVAEETQNLNSKDTEAIQTPKELEDRYLLQIPGASFQLRCSINLAWWNSFAEQEKASREEGLLRTSAFGDENLQKEAAALAEGMDLSTTIGCLEYAYALIPHLEVTQYNETPPSGWALCSMSFYTDGVCSAYYAERTLPDNYEQLAYYERNKLNTYGHGFQLYFSRVDGHVISIQDDYSNLVQGEKAYYQIADDGFENLDAQNFQFLQYSDSSFEELVTGWEAGSEQEKLFEGAPLGITARLDHEKLQVAAAELSKGMNLSDAEQMNQYGERLRELLASPGYDILPNSYLGRQLIRFTDGIWAIIFSGNDPERICYIYVAETDGHIVHIAKTE